VKDWYTLPPIYPRPKTMAPLTASSAARCRACSCRLRNVMSTLRSCPPSAPSSIYPRTGRPGVPSPRGWDAIPGARGCTPQSCAFRDHAAELGGLGARVAGLSAQDLEDQIEFAERNHMPFPIVADPELRLGKALGLPTFEVGEFRLYKRLTLIAERGEIVNVFYPVFPPDRNAADVVAWLRQHTPPSTPAEVHGCEADATRR
jgi:peroxiredoxin